MIHLYLCACGMRKYLVSFHVLVVEHPKTLYGYLYKYFNYRGHMAINVTSILLNKYFLNEYFPFGIHSTLKKNSPVSSKYIKLQNTNDNYSYLTFFHIFLFYNFEIILFLSHSVYSRLKICLSQLPPFSLAIKKRKKKN